MLYLEKIHFKLPEACYAVPPLDCIRETSLRSLESPDKAVKRGTMPL